MTISIQERELMHHGIVRPLSQILATKNEYTWANKPTAADFGIGQAWFSDIGAMGYSNGVEWVTKSAFKHDVAIIICGQSNADGRGANDASNEKSHPSVMMLDKGDNYKMAAEPLGEQVSGWVNNIPNGVNTGTPGHSFGLAMAKNLLANARVKACLVPCAIGGTTLQHWLPGTDDKDMTTLFGAMNYRVSRVRNTAPVVFAWAGHESNGTITESLTTGTQSTEYSVAWYNVIKEIVSRYPGSIFLYAQVATDDTAATATTNRKIAESQRRLETTYGDLTTALGYLPLTTLSDATTFIPSNTNGTNTLTLTQNSVTMVGDGSTALGFKMAMLTAGKRYRCSFTISGTGLCKLLATAEKQASLGAGNHAISFTTDGSAYLQIIRNSAAAATNLVFTNFVLEEVIVPAQANHYMVVTHDLPRNANPDDIHLSQAGQKKLGERMALAYRQFVLGEAVNGKGPRLITTNPITKSGTTITIKFDSTIVTYLAGETGWSYTGNTAANSNFRVYYDGVEKTITAAELKVGDATMIELTVPTVSGVVVVTYGDRVGPGDGTSYRKGVVYDADGLPAPMFGPIIAV